MADAGNVSHWKMELSQPLVTIETVVLISVVKLAVLGVKYSRTIFLVCVERGVVNYTNPPRPCAPMPVTHLQKAPAKFNAKEGTVTFKRPLPELACGQGGSGNAPPACGIPM